MRCVVIDGGVAVLVVGGYLAAVLVCLTKDSELITNPNRGGTSDPTIYSPSTHLSKPRRIHGPRPIPRRLPLVLSGTCRHLAQME